MTANQRFEGKVAVVTGAGSGIGRATAVRMAEEGALVACLDVAAQPLEQTIEAISQLGTKAASYVCDVSSESNVDASISQIAEELGAPTVLCNVAGIGTFAHTTETSFDTWSKIIGVNLTGTFLMCRATLPHMLSEGGGAIVNVASTSGLMGAAYSAAYCASKGGVVMLTKALAIEYADRKITVNAVAPGGVDTPLLSNFGMPEGGDQKHLMRMMSRMGFCTPEQIASAIAFLASAESSYTTGAVLAVDGGITA